MNAEAGGGPRRPARTRSGRLLAVEVLVALAGLFVVFEAQRLLRADWMAAPARHRATEWIGGRSAAIDPKAWNTAREALDAALRITPDDPELHDSLGDLHAVGARLNATDAEQRRAAFDRAIAHYERALALRPGEPGTWAMLALARQARGDPLATVHASWQRALELGPHEGHVHPMLLQTVLADWNAASEPMRAWAGALFDHGDEPMRREINRLAARHGLHFAADPTPTPP